MIHAKRVSSGKYYLVSDTADKDCLLKKYGTTWQIQHTINGARKNVGSYQEAVDHLTKNGW